MDEKAVDFGAMASAEGLQHVCECGKAGRRPTEGQRRKTKADARVVIPL